METKEEQTLTKELEPQPIMENPVPPEHYEIKLNKTVTKATALTSAGLILATALAFSTYKSYTNTKKLEVLFKADRSYFYQASSNVIILRPTQQP